jgi:hypothetical protein
MGRKLAVFSSTNQQTSQRANRPPILQNIQNGTYQEPVDLPKILNISLWDQTKIENCLK